MFTEKLILAHTTFNDMFAQEVIPYIEPKFFEEHIHRVLFSCMKDYHIKYGKTPTKEAMEVALAEETQLNDDQYEEAQHLLSSLQPDPKTDYRCLIKNTETWAKKRNEFNALMECIEISNGKKKGVMSTIISGAEGFSFTTPTLDDHFMKFGARTKKRNPIISGIMSPQDVTFFIGQPGSYKSFISLLLAYCTATGKDFASHTCQKGAVVIFAGEGDGGIEDRVLALEAQYDFRWEDIPCEIISLSDQNNNCPKYDADSKDGNKARVEWVKAHVKAVELKYTMKVNHIIFDTFRTAVNNIDENMAKHVTPAMMHFKAIASDNDAAVSIIHHTNRELKDYSGSGSFKSDCDNIYFIEAGEKSAVLTRNGQQGKQKDFATLDDIAFKMFVHETGEYENGETVTSLAATFSGEPAAAKTIEEDIVLVLVKEHYANEIFNGPLLKSDLLQKFKDHEKGTGSGDALAKRFREKHFMPLLDDGYINYVASSYVGSKREDGIVTLRVEEVAPLAIVAE